MIRELLQRLLTRARQRRELRQFRILNTDDMDTPELREIAKQLDAMGEPMDARQYRTEADRRDRIKRQTTTTTERKAK
jgi:hypothetical protein